MMDKFNLAYLISDLIDINMKEFADEFLVEPYSIHHCMSKNCNYITVKNCELYDYEDEIAENLMQALKNYIITKDADITSKHNTTLDEVVDLDTLAVFFNVIECSGCIFIELP